MPWEVVEPVDDDGAPVIEHVGKGGHEDIYDAMIEVRERWPDLQEVESVDADGYRSFQTL